ncbi:hypothetical protein ACMBCN_00610 [Candidatus Liberibacter asiaticus]
MLTVIVLNLFRSPTPFFFFFFFFFFSLTHTESLLRLYFSMTFLFTVLRFSKTIFVLFWSSF